MTQINELTIPSELAVRSTGAAVSKPVFVLMPDTRIRYANSAAAQLLNAEPSTVEGLILIDTLANPLAVEIAQRAPAVLATSTDTIFEVKLAGRTWLCHVVPLSDLAGCARVLSVFCHDVTHIHEHSRQQLAAQQQLTQTLVREVRHRVKNHLQGVVGLLRQHQLLETTATSTLNNAITQLLAISAVYGLEARVNEDRIYLCSVVAEVVNALRATYQTIHLQDPERDRRAILAEVHAVPIALVINELITNAIKHTPQQQGAKISVTLEFTPLLARLKIFNVPARLQLNAEGITNETAGAGLNLARALLPFGHASLSVTNEGNGVLTVLTLLPPIVILKIAEEDQMVAL